MTPASSSLDPGLVLHVGAFLVAALACFASIPRLAAISDADTRRGLRWLLLTSGGWAAAHVGYLLAPGVDLKLAAYSVGLVAGFAAVGAWLYVCSAYTGRTYHRRSVYRRAALLVFGLVIALKLTNPLHQAYYTATISSTPFPHLAVATGTLHWVAMGLAYALAFVGYFMLFELFTEIDYDTRPLLVLVAITGSPVLLDVVAATTPVLVDVTYEPLGVAVFAVGVAFVYRDQFEDVRLAAEQDTPVVALDSDDRIRDANHAAKAIFPALETGTGASLASVLPDVAACLERDDAILPVRSGDTTRFYHVTESPYGTNQSALGRTIVLTDVTNQERYRRELERQNERLETFASMVSHDLRNPLNVAQGRLDLLREDLEPGDANVEAAERALDRMEELIDDILTLARTGQPIEAAEPIDLASFARERWEMVERGDATLEVTAGSRLRADPDRLKRLFENLFRNSIDHGDDTVTVTVGLLSDDEGFYVADDGPGIPEADRDRLFDPGYSTREEGTGFGLAIVKEVVDAHDWTISVTESADGGAQFEVRGVEIED